MKQITKTELKRKGVEFTEDSPFPLPYVVDGVDINGGYFTMYVPVHLGLTKEDIKECADYIKREHDVVKLTVTKCRLINK